MDTLWINILIYNILVSASLLLLMYKNPRYMMQDYPKEITQGIPDGEVNDEDIERRFFKQEDAVMAWASQQGDERWMGTDQDSAQHRVIGFDREPSRTEMLDQGRSHLLRFQP